MTILVTQAAAQELIAAIAFYENNSPGLGTAFYKEVAEAVEFINEFPSGWQKAGAHTRKCVLKKFPYLILYIAENDRIIITAIAHQHRHPRSYSR